MSDRPSAWQERTLQRLERLGFAGFSFGPGVRWWPLTASGRKGEGSFDKAVGPFYSTEEFDRWLDAQENRHE